MEILLFLTSRLSPRSQELFSNRENLPKFLAVIFLCSNEEQYNWDVNMLNRHGLSFLFVARSSTCLEKNDGLTFLLVTLLGTCFRKNVLYSFSRALRRPYLLRIEHQESVSATEFEKSYPTH